MSAQGPPSARASVADRPMPLQQASTFFVLTLVGAVAVAIFTGDPQLAWGYVGAFTLTVAIGIGLALRADQHNRALAQQKDPGR